VIAFPEVEPVAAQLDPDRIADDLGPLGPIARAMQRYEDRPSQREMARAIASLYNDGGTGLLEAGTGVGKSLAYLIPALRWAHLTGERTVVSTNTINLQEQLVGKDLPFLSAALSGEQAVRFALVKGWRNYLCLLRFEQARVFGEALFDNASEDFKTLTDWVSVTTDGSVSDLPRMIAPETWDEVAAEPDLCIRNDCPHFERCFFFRSRRQAANADVVVANHHLLMSDVAIRRVQGNWEETAVLPPYSRLVIDEGHHLEEAAASHLGATATRAGLLRLLSRISRPASGSRPPRGLLPLLDLKLRSGSDLFSHAGLQLLREKIAPAVDAIRDKGTTLFHLMEAVLRESPQQTVVRLTPDFAMHPVWRSGLDAAFNDLLSEISRLVDALALIRDRWASKLDEDAALAALVSEMHGIGRRLEAFAIALDGALDSGPGSHERIRWVELRGRDNIALTWVPLDLAPILREDLFSRLKTTIVTSATLVADGGFDFLAERIGADGLRIPPVAAAFPSPFDFARQAVLAIPTDTPSPSNEAERHVAAVTRMIADFADASDGGLFALFTSHRDVRDVSARLRAMGVGEQRPLLVHGEESRDLLLAKFRESGRAVLVGTSSYWEGVDVPGHALRGLLIARLPFRVPTEPVTAAHCEAIIERGGDAFAEYMVPHAALRLKQGFGRLIRTGTDRGAIVIADSRIISKDYGAALLRGLPPARRLMATWNEIARQLADFYSVSDQSHPSAGIR
jgi:ATP-dependent DNA helicase DinG